MLTSGRPTTLAALLVTLFLLTACTFQAPAEWESQPTSPPAPFSTPLPTPADTAIPSDIEPPVPDFPAPDFPVPGSPVAQIQQLLAGLPTKGRAPKTGYSRQQFGQRWSDDVSVQFGHNGCDTRNDILQRDLINTKFKPNTRDCVVLSGELMDPYTGQVLQFQRGQDTSSLVQIDHVVALSDAWQKGAQQLTEAQRQDFANDPLNLLAVDGPANQQKRDSDAASWLPSNKAYRCQYVARQVVVKHRYGLWVTAAESDALGRWLQSCTVEDDATLEELVNHG